MEIFKDPNRSIKLGDEIGELLQGETFSTGLDAIYVAMVEIMILMAEKKVNHD